MSDHRDSILTHITRQLKRREPGRPSPTLSFVILALLVFAVALAWTPRASHAQQAPVTPTPTNTLEVTSTALPTRTATTAPTSTLDSTPAAAFVVASTAAEPVDTPTPMVKPTRTPTPIPMEWQTNEKETDGLILGAVVLVLIVIGGTLHAIRSNG